MSSNIRSNDRLLVPFLLDAVDALDLRQVQVNVRGAGSPPSVGLVSARSGV